MCVVVVVLEITKQHWITLKVLHLQIDCNRERRDRPQVSKPRPIVQIREVTTTTFNCKLVKMIQKVIKMKHKTCNGYWPLPECWYGRLNVCHFSREAFQLSRSRYNIQNMQMYLKTQGLLFLKGGFSNSGRAVSCRTPSQVKMPILDREYDRSRMLCI